ncbi:MAG: CHAP domain-containing protein [Clostridia bacterium]|nr:CHAP domain-containing protein [Clostridia bacterium]
MADIKTRDVVKVMIKTIDKSATASHRIKSAYIQTKDKAENFYYKNEDFSDDYATDKVSKMGHRVAEESKKQLSKQRQKGVKNSKDNIQKTRARINSRKQQKVGNETYRITCVSGKDIHRADKDILKIQTHKSSQNTNKSIKTAQRTKKTIKQTTRCSGGKIKPSAKGTVKSAKSSFKITEKTTAQKAPRIFKSTKEVTRATIKAIMAGTKSLVSAIVAGGWVAVILIVIICITGMVASSCFGILFSNEDTGSPQNMSAVVHEVNDEYQTRLDEIEAENNFDVLDVSGSLAAWKEVLSVYAIKVTTDGNEPQEVATMTEEKKELLKSIFWEMNDINFKTEPKAEKLIEIFDDGYGNAVKTETIDIKTYLYITLSHKTADEMADKYRFSLKQRQQLFELMAVENDSMWNDFLYEDS